MKGISAMISTILLIAFTVAVGGIISLFLTGFTKTQTGTAESAGANVTKCGGASIDILTVGGPSTNRTIYANPSSQNITSITFTLTGGNITTPSSQTLTPGSVASVAIFNGNITSVTAYGLCLGSVAVKGVCTTGQSCWASS